MPLIRTIVLITGAIMLARSTLFWLHWIQMKHYRLDRIWFEMKQRALWKLVFSKHRIIILALFALWLVLIEALLVIRELPVFFGITLQSLIVIYLLVYTLTSIFTVARHQLQVPSLTTKITALFLAVIFFELILLYRSADPTIFILLIETLQPLIVLTIFTIVYTPNILLHQYFINCARKRLSTHKNLVVIGITGSYGKTTTKEFLAHILNKKFKVLKTPAHINVDTGVAKVILGDLKPEHEVFIVEMGAYKRGEIKKICDLVRPQYAVLTGLSDQHLELFGSMEAIADTKFELVEAVRDQAHIIANADSELLVSEFKRRHLMPRWYGITASATRFKPTEIMYSEKGTSFTLHGVQFQVPTAGTASLNNLLGATTIAVELGFHLKDIAPLVRDLAPVSHTMELKSTPRNALVLDDIYNANTEGVITALYDLKYFNRSKRICVFSEVIELGERTKEDHTNIAKTIVRTTEYVLLLPSRMRAFICDTLLKEGYKKSHILSTDDAEKLKTLADAEAVILFEGRGGEKIMGKLYAS